ncbi:MAG TPA: KamA family radical SAM protein [Geobacteraceae bacterium]|nr:KamA family radical SAM protein [Geobacteraceae bacterium]
MTKNRYLTRLSQVSQLADTKDLHSLQKVEQRYAFRSNEYYLSLIDWDDPRDPIRRIVIPHQDEHENWGQLDASGEHNYAKARGLEHKYPDTALLLTSDVCGSLCRFCFRKRIFMADNNEVSRDVSAGLAYIRKHPEINNVLLTGGDPLLLSTLRLEKIIAELRSIDHVKIIRIGSKMPAFNPFRILDDPALLEMLAKYSLPERRIYLMAHFNHPRELTSEAILGMTQVQQAGVAIMNQTPLIRGVNDDAGVLAELLNTLSFMGIAPYYVFQCRPTEGNSAYTVPVEEGYRIFARAIRQCSGLARRCRYSMSHVTGKIEVVGMTEEQIFFRYHRPADPEQDPGEIIACQRNPEAYWFDDYLEDTPMAVAYGR